MRKLERALPSPALGSLVDVLTCPAGHKYELVGLSVYNDLVHDYTWYLFLHTGVGVYPELDQIDVKVPRVVEHKQYEGTVIHAGESLTLYAVTTGTTVTNVIVSYIDVSPVL